MLRFINQKKTVLKFSLDLAMYLNYWPDGISVTRDITQLRTVGIKVVSCNWNGSQGHDNIPRGFVKPSGGLQYSHLLHRFQKQGIRQKNCIVKITLKHPTNLKNMCYLFKNTNHTMRDTWA